jgi:hypothetical protein
VAERPRFLLLFAFFLATGLIAFAYLGKTVYRGAGEKLSAHDGAIATRAIVTHWMRDGYFASHGLLNAVPLFSLFGTYLIYAAVFSQHVAMHPYLFDTMLATPLIVALFVVVPALAEAATEQRSVFVLIAAIAATWTAMVNLRLYALSYPA